MNREGKGRPADVLFVLSYTYYPGSFEYSYLSLSVGDSAVHYLLHSFGKGYTFNVQEFVSIQDCLLKESPRARYIYVISVLYAGVGRIFPR